MRKPLLLICLLALFLAAPAQAKGPDRATMTGPGLEKPLVFYGPDGTAPLGLLTQQGGFWVQAFGLGTGRVDEGKAVAAKPRGNLGPRYLIVYRVPGGTKTPSLLRQELYPYAAQPVSYMPKQRFWQTRIAPGGWYQWGLELKAALVKAGLPATAPARQQAACAVTKSLRPSQQYGTSGLWVMLPSDGVLRVQRNQPDDGLFGTKIGWIPDRDRNLTLAVSGERLDAPGKMRVLGVFWGYSSTGKGSWASAVAFPEGGCWRITGRAGPTTLSYVVRVVTEG